MRDQDAAESLPFTLNETHYLILSRIESEQERNFYESETVRQQWSAEQLQRFYDYDLFGRYAISCDKDALMNTARTQS